MREYTDIVRRIENLPVPTRKINAHSGDSTGHGGEAMFRMSGSFVAVRWSCGSGWDHVSVSFRKRTPKYQEMKWFKHLFFKDDEWAIEYHPPKEDYISIHDNVLHLWRPHHEAIPTPPKAMV